MKYEVQEKIYQRHITGKTGEDVAIKYLMQKEYKIIERNFFCKQGELDIVAKDKKELIFIEVKTRKNKAYGRPIDAITSYKQKHIIKSIEYYLFKYKLENIPIRIDVIEVYEKGENKYFVNHIKNAIQR